MALNFRKRKKIAPGIFINFGKSGISTTIGGHGASVSFGSHGTYLNTGIPGSGLYSRQKLSGIYDRGEYSNNSSQGGRFILLIIICAFLLFLLFCVNAIIALCALVVFIVIMICYLTIKHHKEIREEKQIQEEKLQQKEELENYYKDIHWDYEKYLDVNTSNFDEQWKDVAIYIVKNLNTSVANIQRNFNMGYNTAGRIMQQLESIGLVGKLQENKNRELLCGNIDELESYFSIINQMQS